MSSSRPGIPLALAHLCAGRAAAIITLIFFIWPAGEALWYSLQTSIPWPFQPVRRLDNFVALFHDPYYWTRSGPP